MINTPSFPIPMLRHVKVASDEPCVHLVDDDHHFRTAIELLLSTSGIVSKGYHSAEHFLTMYAPRKIECLLLDLRMPGIGGVELQRELHQRHISMPVIVISAFAETPSVVATIRNGAIDFLEKPIEEAALIEKVNKALATDRSRKAESGDLHLRLHRLSDRERQVMQGFLDAKTTQEVARELEISPKTVEKHRVRIFDKLEVASIPELMCVLARQKR
ncbi:response regulator transcription factor [Anatilimnocola sp. NA78]|uniref:response regulator transcription factor n=1 Tax=Anatilimnocola sp. NA78 TaxID=3415683 RepID=UPI003CE534D2